MIKEYLVLCVDEDGMFAERYEVSAANAKQAVKRAMSAYHVEGGHTQKEADDIAKVSVFSFQKCTGGNGPVWSCNDDAMRWLIIRR